MLYSDPSDEVRLDPFAACEIPSHVGLNKHIQEAVVFAHVKKLRFNRESGRHIRADRSSDNEPVVRGRVRPGHALRRSDNPMFEFACHEGNCSMAGILAEARAEER